MVRGIIRTRPRDRILLKGMVFFAYHGAKPAEQELGQRFIVDVRLNADLAPAGQSDELASTVHYGHVYRLVKQVVESTRFDLLEALAEKLTAEILAGFPAVEEVLVRVKKPSVPLPGPLDYAGVEIVRRRQHD